MKITCTQENLSQGLLTTSHVATKSVNLPILSNVLIQARKNTITISATNLEMGVINSVRGKIEEDGDITIQSKLLSDYINLLPKENVTLSVKGDSDEVFVNVKNSVTKIKGIGASDYP
jgi:DNA polymerase III subunit beta